MKKFKEIVLYLIFGVLTTLVNLAVFHLCNKVMDVLVSNIIAWIAAVIFAFITNKLFVFESKSWSPKVVGKEIPTFAAARLLTLGIEEAGLIIMIKWLSLEAPLGNFAVKCFDLVGKIGIHFPEKIVNVFDGKMMVKIILAVIVVVLNYVFSKLIIFKKKDSAEE